MKYVWTKENATKLLRVALDDEAINFRDGQWETIDALIHGRKKILLVQRTGWGKSIVYTLHCRRDTPILPVYQLRSIFVMVR